MHLLFTCNKVRSSRLEALMIEFNLNIGTGQGHSQADWETDILETDI